MSETYVMDRDLVDEHVAGLKRASDAFDDLLGESDRLAAMLEDDGVLLGRAGEAAAEALRNNLKGAVHRLRERLQETAQEVQQHAEEMRKTERENAARF